MALLLLVDGSSYLYRAYHALPDLRTREGFPTGAMKGVLSMLRRLEVDFKADYKAVIFDAKGKTFRDDWYPEYKAHRPPMPEDLVLQIVPIHEAIRAAGWPLLMKDGVEADDVIGTLSRRATELGLETVISTGDKDLAQLVNSKVRLVNTMTEEILDEAGVLNKFGVAPNRIVDYLTLVGDTVDNIPGVPKCGPKTAVKWLEQYGSLEGVIANADQITGAVGENLRQHKDFLPLGRKLVTVDCELSQLPAPGELTPQAQDKDTLVALYQRFEFRSWLRELEASGVTTDNSNGSEEEAPSAAASGVHRAGYETILDWPAFDAWLARIEAASLTALDTETT
ncbi:MAG: 5'-3' exonuclease H3TH domain-containing protein, partial [Azovibrio sp.]